MPINQYFPELPGSSRWTQKQYTMESSSNHYNIISEPTTTSSSAAAIFDDQLMSEQEIPKRILFEKPLTPSDVGKLNRLVIPKQHAEKHFPLNTAATGDSGEKGLLLSFEDELGKQWRFRYSYWNSSQSYVLTKGWSRFVKEKRLNPGDIVIFQRHQMDCGRFFIGWKRRNIGTGQDSGFASPAPVASGGGEWTSQVVYSGQYPYPIHSQRTSLPCQSDYLLAGSVLQGQSTANGNSKRLRLFGVNLECHAEESLQPSESNGSPMSSQGEAQMHHQF